MFDTDIYETKMNSAFVHFEDELKKIRTGRAHPDMLDGVLVEVYGTKMPLNQVANVTVPEPQLIQVNPFDPSNVQAVVAAIRDVPSLGFNPSDDGRVVRVPVPALTEDRRRELVKVLGDKVEDCRIALRNIRQDALKDARRMKESKELSEDDVKAVEREIDTLMQVKQSLIDDTFTSKQKEVMTI